MTAKQLPLLLAVLILSLAASAQDMRHIPVPVRENPAKTDQPPAVAVWANNTLYLNGWHDPDPQQHTNTSSQTIGALTAMQKFLASQHLGLRDVVMVRDYWINDPARDSTADRQGVKAGFAQFFGTRKQPNEPAHTAMEAVLPSAVSGVLVQFDIIAVRPNSMPVRRIPWTLSQNPSRADFPSSQGVWAGDTLYVSGWVDSDLKTHTTTESQTVGILKEMQIFLASQGLTLGDMVMIREYIGLDKDGKYDRPGVRAGLVQFVGTKDQPNKPASTGIAVVLPERDRGALIKLDIIAVRSKSTSVHRIPLTLSQNPTRADLPFSQAVWAGDTLYVSGWLDAEMSTHTDTKSQTVAMLKDIQGFLAIEHLTLGDVAQMYEFLGGDPARGGKADFVGARAGTAEVFGTKDQPDTPSSAEPEVVLLAGARGGLAEIDMIAVRPNLNVDK